MNENILNNTQTNIKLETKQDAERLLEELIEKKNQIIDDAPKLSLAIKKAPYFLDALFEPDGTPKYDFGISDRFRKKVSLALKHPRKDTKTGQTYYGEIWTSGYHKKAYEVYKKIGFKECGRYHKALYHESKYHDIILMELLKENYYD